MKLPLPTHVEYHTITLHGASNKNLILFHTVVYTMSDLGASKVCGSILRVPT